jgi:hypothetical protein
MCVSIAIRVSQCTIYCSNGMSRTYVGIALVIPTKLRLKVQQAMTAAMCLLAALLLIATDPIAATYGAHASAIMRVVLQPYTSIATVCCK